MNNCGCNNDSSTFKCNRLGTFTANDVNCINPPIPADSSIIPFSSGISLSRITDKFGNREVSLLGFGTATLLMLMKNNTIDLTNLFNEAFPVPCDGKITAISASFFPFDEFIFEGSITIRAQIFLAPKGSNIFTGTSASVDLAPPITDPFPFGQIAFASANIPPVPVTVDDRLLMVFYISSATDTFGIADILGKASAAINIV